MVPCSISIWIAATSPSAKTIRSDWHKFQASADSSLINLLSTRRSSSFIRAAPPVAPLHSAPNLCQSGPPQLVDSRSNRFAPCADQGRSAKEVGGSTGEGASMLHRQA
eukprot:scaffold51630_cov64-Phaeocystis_antarctica.AAC.5